jgi:putative acyl-CoA dehydrogenase
VEQARSLQPDSPAAAFTARSAVEQLAVAMQATLLVEYSPGLADAFIASRVGGGHGHTFGTLPADLAGATVPILDRIG